MKIVKRIYNDSKNSGNIWNFQWKDNIMKSATMNLHRTPPIIEKTEHNVPLKIFEQVTDDLKNELGLLGPWNEKTLVAKCAPKINW